MTTPTGPDEMRASDAERAHAADQLSRALVSGRLNQDEYTDRAAKATAAKTRGELALLTADLPLDAGPAPASLPLPAPAPAVGTTVATPDDGGFDVAELAASWRSWAGGAVLLTAIWGFSSLASGHLTSFWPVWPLGFWALGLVIHGVQGSRRNN